MLAARRQLSIILKLLLAALVILCLWFCAGVLVPLDVPEPNVRPGQLLVSKVRLVDVESGEIRDNQDILVANGEIVEVGVALAAPGAQVLDGRGRYAIPGLFDMHVHSLKLAPSLTHPLFIAAGVTAVRDMGGCIGIDDPWVACVEDKRSWNRTVGAGEMLGPRYDQVTSLAINGGSEIPTSLDRELGAGTAAAAVARVAYDRQRGIDFLKPYTMLPREGYFSLARAALEQDMYLAGHQPLAVSALEAIAAGQRSIEHAFLFIWDCYPDMAELRKFDNPRAVYTKELRQRMIAEHDAEACAVLQQAMVSAGVAYVPTHTTRKLDAYALDETFRDDERLQYVPAPLRMMWLQDADGMAARAGQGGQDSYRDFYEFGIRQTGMAHRAGVTVLAGTDAPDSFAFPGFALHDELDHFVAAGISTLDTLRSATLQPARFLGLADRAGVIKPGARGDIILLRENPLADIGAVRAIDAVVLAGTPYNRSDLDKILADVADRSDSWGIWPKFLWQALTSPIMRRQFAD